MGRSYSLILGRNVTLGYKHALNAAGHLHKVVCVWRRKRSRLTQLKAEITEEPVDAEGRRPAGWDHMASDQRRAAVVARASSRLSKRLGRWGRRSRRSGGGRRLDVGAVIKKSSKRIMKTCTSMHTYVCMFKCTHVEDVGCFTLHGRGATSRPICRTRRAFGCEPFRC